MTLKHITVFCTICEEMSMTKAAERLFMTQPAVSRMIGELEKYYEVRLFDRIDRRLYLTAAGKQLWQDGKNVLLGMEQLENHLKSQTIAPVLKVGCSIGIGVTFLNDYLKQYYLAYPNTLIRITESHSSSIEEQVVMNELDLGVIEGLVHSPSLICVPFHQDDLAAVCAPSHPAALKAQKDPGRIFSLEELDHIGLYLPENGTGTRESLNQAAKKDGFALHPVWSSINYVNILRQAEEGAAVTILSRHLVRGRLETGVLTELKTDFHIERTFHIIWHKNKYLAPNGRYFAELWTGPASANFPTCSPSTKERGA